MAKDSKLTLKPSGKNFESMTEEANQWVEERAEKEIPKPSPLQGQIKRITFEIDGEKHQAIKLEALKKGMTIKQLMLRLVDEFLEETEGV
ncbi:hypothetical protein IQ255_07915 [Pleurocapsales cyanobacterium LEGE 10410]|nr:hypothetical protein [Pleurocapsales cyanobacterium LEGE 10410]